MLFRSADFILGADYTAYDRLAQLVDYLALPTGFCIIEKRMVDVGRRHGVDAGSIARWNRVFELKEEFDREIGGNLYMLLPGIAENSIFIYFNLYIIVYKNVSNFQKHG